MSQYYNDYKKQKNKRLEQLGKTFYDLTKYFTHIDWRTLRDETYWMSDGMEEERKLEHKISCIIKYKKKQNDSTNNKSN